MEIILREDVEKVGAARLACESRRRLRAEFSAAETARGKIHRGQQ